MVFLSSAASADADGWKPPFFMERSYRSQAVRVLMLAGPLFGIIHHPSLGKIFFLIIIGMCCHVYFFQL